MRLFIEALIMIAIVLGAPISFMIYLFFAIMPRENAIGATVFLFMMMALTIVAARKGHIPVGHGG